VKAKKRPDRFGAFFFVPKKDTASYLIHGMQTETNERLSEGVFTAELTGSCQG
jgi:hypothetical protein